MDMCGGEKLKWTTQMCSTAMGQSLRKTSEEGAACCGPLLKMFAMSFDYLGLENAGSLLAQAYEKGEIEKMPGELEKERWVCRCNSYSITASDETFIINVGYLAIHKPGDFHVCTQIHLIWIYRPLLCLHADIRIHCIRHWH
jgi:hypothetical protein